MSEQGRGAQPRAKTNNGEGEVKLDRLRTTAAYHNVPPPQHVVLDRENPKARAPGTAKSMLASASQALACILLHRGCILLRKGCLLHRGCILLHRGVPHPGPEKRGGATPTRSHTPSYQLAPRWC